MSNAQEGIGAQPGGLPDGPQQGATYQEAQTRPGGSYDQRQGGQTWQGGNPGQGGPFIQRGNGINVRSTFKTTEFWIFVFVSIALLIASAVTDQGADGQGFGAQAAWRYVTFLAIGYMLSRGLTKFGHHDEHDHH